MRENVQALPDISDSIQILRTMHQSNFSFLLTWHPRRKKMTAHFLDWGGEGTCGGKLNYKNSDENNLKPENLTNPIAQVTLSAFLMDGAQ